MHPRYPLLTHRIPPMRNTHRPPESITGIVPTYAKRHRKAKIGSESSTLMKGIPRDSNSIHIDVPWVPTSMNHALNTPADADWFVDAAVPPASSLRALKRQRAKQLKVWVTAEEHAGIVTRAGMMAGGDVGEYVRRRCLGQRLHANVGGHAIRILMRISRTVAERYPADQEFHEEIISAIEAAGLAANL